MNAEQILQHFERISEAPDAIPRLRRFILDLAVRGKLVEQDPNDEPAAELVRWIQAEKALMVADGAVRREKPFALVDQSTAPFPCPPGWIWTYLGMVSLNVQGFAFSSALFSKNSGEGLPLVRIGDIGTDCPEVFTSEFPGNAFLVEPGDILLGLSGSIKSSVWGGPQALLNQRIARLRPVIREMPVEWLQIAVGSCIAKWKEETSKLTVQNIKAAQLSGALIALPPLAELHRIVAKVDELMSLCDQLEAAKAEREQFRDRLVAASLQGLNQPAEEEETFREHARFTFAILPRITTRAAHIKQLRQTILNLAVRGKLVAQDPSDEPAAELLRWIKAEKDLLVAQGVLRREKPLPIVDEAATLFPTPNGWAWTRLGAITIILQGFPFSSEYFTKDLPTALPLIKIGDIGSDAPEVLTSEMPDHSYLVNPGDILLGLSGSIKCSIWHGPKGLLNQRIARIRPAIDELPVKWLLFAVNSCIDKWKQETSKLTVQNIKAGQLYGAVVPLPPLAEQHRIVEKVDELMAICDQLEAQITVTEQDSRRFLEAVLSEALSPALLEAA